MAQMELEAYRQSREALLATIVETLTGDERVVAAWLTGSYARGDADAVSDIDLTTVIADEHAATLCRRAEMVTAWPPAERMQLLTQFGQPANVHENNHNAPEGGAFTSVLYQPSARVDGHRVGGHIVDWILVPYSKARRPDGSRLLFERAPIPPALPPAPIEPATLAAQVAERIAFIWMMAAVVAKYLVRGDLGLVRCWIDELNLTALDVERRLAGSSGEYRKGPSRALPLTTTSKELAMALTNLCGKVEELMGVAGGMGIALRPAPREAIDSLMRLLS